MIVESRVGSKGELFLSKEIRTALGLHPGDPIYFEVQEGGLLVRRIPDLLEMLSEPPIGEPESPEDIEQDVEKFFKVQETHSTGDD